MDIRATYTKTPEVTVTSTNSNSSVLPQVHVAAPDDKEKVEASVNVTLSKEGKEKSEQAEVKDHFASLRGAETNTTDKKKSKEEQLEEKIKELKDKIAELQQKLIQQKNSPGSEDKVKQTESELAVLQAQLMSLLNEKLQGKGKS